jgi:hypothetical protein
MPRKGYSIKLSALQIQALNTYLREAYLEQDPILKSAAIAIDEQWQNNIVPTELGQKPKVSKQVQPVEDESTDFWKPEEQSPVVEVAGIDFELAQATLDAP